MQELLVQYLPILMFLGIAVVLAALMLIMSLMVAQQKPGNGGSDGTRTRHQGLQARFRVRPWFLDMDRARKYIKPSPRRLRPAGEPLEGV